MHETIKYEYDPPEKKSLWARK